MVEILIIVILAIALILALFYIVLIKIQMKKTRKELKKTREDGYNKMLTVTLADKEKGAKYSK